VGRIFIVFCHDRIDELGAGLINSSHLLTYLFLLFNTSYIFGTEDNALPPAKQQPRVEYYKYWNAYRRIVDLRGEPQSFYGKQHYQVTYNKENRIKYVTRFGKDREAKETYYLIWSRSGARSEYKVEFHTGGNTSRLDPYLYANELSYVRPGWIAEFISRSDGRPREVSFRDAVGFKYFYYHFNYTFVRENNVFSEVVESSYFDSNGEFVGRHLLYWEKGAYLRMIQYFNSENTIIQTKEFIHDRKLGETVRVIMKQDGKELERKIVPYMQPDKYAYKYEWTGREIIDHGLLEIDNLDLAIEFAARAVEALSKANEELRIAKEALEKANERARNAQKLLKKAEGQAKDVESFQARMEEARKDAQKAIETMYDAEREAERARLEAAAAVATLDAIRKTKDVEDYAQEEAKKTKKEAKQARKEARRLARETKRAVQDSILGSGPKSFLTIAYGQPILVESTLKDHIKGVNYTFGLGRRNMFEFDGKDIDLGLEVNWFDFKSDSVQENFQTLSYFLIAQIDPRIAWSWVPSTLKTGIKIGGGLVSPGYGFTLGGSAVFNLLPTPLTIGLTSQFNWVSGVINKDTKTYWTTIGLVFGVNLQDKLAEILDIDFPDIF